MRKLKRDLFIALPIILQMIFILVAVLDWVGISTYPIRQIVGFLCITFMPGYLILNILKINKLNMLERMLYSVGLSISFVMFTGLLLNSTFLIINDIINIIIPNIKPFSEHVLMITFNIILFLLYLIFLINYESEFSTTNQHNEAMIVKDKFLLLKTRFIVIMLIVALLLSISIIGAQFLLYYNTNIIFLLMTLIIVAVIVLTLMSNTLEDECSFIVWAIFLALLFSETLSIKYLPWHSGDPALEYYFAYLVKANGFWDISIPDNRNSMLSVVILQPIYSIMLNVNLKDVFRVIYPIIYSFTSLAIYATYRKLGNDKKIAFLATLLFILFPFSYLPLSKCVRQGIAMFFLALFLLLIVSRNITGYRRSLLLIAFSSSIIVSHYSTSYIFMLVLYLVLLLQYILHLIYTKKKIKLYSTNGITLNLVMLYTVLCIFWYLYTSLGKPYKSLIDFIKHVKTQISSLLLSESSYTIYALSEKWVFSIEITKYLIFIISVFIFIGVILTAIYVFSGRIINMNDNINCIKLQYEYSLFLISFFVILISTVLPTKDIFSTPRVYPICLITLSIISIVGFIRINNIVYKKIIFILKNFKLKNWYHCKYYYILYSIFLILLLLFGYGFVSEVITKDGDYPPNVIISKPRSMFINDAQYLRSFYGLYFSDKDAFSAKWLASVRDESLKIYLDPYSDAILISILGPNWIRTKPPLNLFNYVTNKSDVKSGYIYLRTYNVLRQVSIHAPPPRAYNLSEVYPIDISNKIYTNGGSEIYYYIY